MKKLTKKELLFCRLYADCGNGREAASRAGYKVMSEAVSKKLLDDEDIVQEIARIRKGRASDSAEVAAGLRRIAFGSVADAVKLIFSEGLTDEDIEALDLFNVAEIKCPKSGGVEIKFFDRIKALEKLQGVCDSRSGGSVSFIEALEKSAKAVREEEQ